MAEKKTTPITINGNNYVYEDMTQEQQVLFNHCIDLDRKMNSAQFNLSQLQVGKDAFLGKLTASLGANPPEVPEAQETAPAAA
jgi:hypothetical protein